MDSLTTLILIGIGFIMFICTIVTAVASNTTANNIREINKTLQKLQNGNK